MTTAGFVSLATSFSGSFAGVFFSSITTAGFVSFATSFAGSFAGVFFSSMTTAGFVSLATSFSGSFAGVFFSSMTTAGFVSFATSFAGSFAGVFFSSMTTVGFVSFATGLSIVTAFLISGLLSFVFSGCFTSDSVILDVFPLSFSTTRSSMCFFSTTTSVGFASLAVSFAGVFLSSTVLAVLVIFSFDISELGTFGLVGFIFSRSVTGFFSVDVGSFFSSVLVSVFFSVLFSVIVGVLDSAEDLIGITICVLPGQSLNFLPMPTLFLFNAATSDLVYLFFIRSSF